MSNLVDDLEEADELIRNAESNLRSAAQEIEKIASNNSTVKAKPEIEESAIRVEVNHRNTIQRLNEELPFPFYAREKDEGIVVSTLELPDEIEGGERYPTMKEIVFALEETTDMGAPIKAVVEYGVKVGYEKSKVEHEIEKLKHKGEVYEPATDRLRTT